MLYHRNFFVPTTVTNYVFSITRWNSLKVGIIKKNYMWNYTCYSKQLLSNSKCKKVWLACLSENSVENF